MVTVFGELNKDQLSGLANLCFDLAKGAFAIAFFPTLEISTNPVLGIVRVFIALITGLAFTYAALVLLKLKEGKQK